MVKVVSQNIYLHIKLLKKSETILSVMEVLSVMLVKLLKREKQCLLS